MSRSTPSWTLALWAIALLGLFAVIRWDTAEQLSGLSRRWEHFELDEILLAVAVASGFGTLYGLSRARRLEDAVGEREGTRLRLQESELWRHLVSENLPLGLLEYDADGLIAHANERLAVLADLGVEELVGRKVEDLIPGLAEIVPHVVGVLQLDRTLRTTGGTDLWVRLQVSPISDGSNRRCGGLILVTDISEQKRHELEQERLQERLLRVASEWKVTFDEVESPILILDEMARVRRLNRAARELIGRSYAEILDCTLEEISPFEPWRSLVELVGQTRHSEGSRSLQISEDEDTGRSWDLTATPVRRPIYGTSVILIARDTTAVVELQKSLQHNELMSAMGALVAGVAHEVRNPLFGISATLDAFEARLEAEHPYHRFLQVLRTEVDRMGNLMTELLDYGKPLELQPSLESLRSVILEAIEHCETLIQQSEVTVQVEMARNLRPLRMDRRHMVQVFKNLVANAIQHSPSPGEVEVHLEATDDGLHRCTIRDRGKGFTEANLERVFEPFFSERQGGVGLGLSIVQRFVVEQGGTVRAFNHEQGGAVVEIALPSLPPPGPVVRGFEREPSASSARASTPVGSVPS